MVNICSSRNLLFAAASVLVAVAASTPARAGDDGQAPLWSSIGGMLGLTDTDKFEDTIKYGEKPRLVLPPSGDLPPPVASAEMGPAWPHDPDVLRMEKKKADAQKRVVRYAPDRERGEARTISPDLLRSDHAAPGSLGLADSCQTSRHECHWIRPDILEKLGLKHDDNAIVAGQEPDREWLTDPPKGYRLPTNSTKATFDAPDHANKADPRYELYKAPTTDAQ
jgi:hypothetical protein